MMSKSCGSENQFFLQQNVHQKLQGLNLPEPTSVGSTLMSLATQLRNLIDEC